MVAAVKSFYGEFCLYELQSSENHVYKYLDQQLSKLPNIIFYNDISDSIGSRSFNFKGIIHDDIGILLDKMGIAVRVGHHCAQPLMQRLGIEGTVRASFAMYNTKSEIDTLVAGIERVSKMF